MVALQGSDGLELAIGVRVAAVAVVVLVAGLVQRWSPLVAVALAGVGAVYATRLALEDPPLDVRAAALGALLYVTAELAYWSLEAADEVKEEPGAELRRLAVVASFGVAALVASALPLALVEIVRAGGLAVDLLGAAAAAGALIALAVAARRGDRTGVR